MNLSDLRPPAGSRRKPKRIGRGPGSGWGKTAGRGEKGQKSRTGYRSKRGFEGGQMPLVRRVPKRGFTNIFRKEYAVVNLARLNAIEGDEFTPESLLERRVIRKLGDGLKILAVGDLERAVTVRAHKFSGSAREKIEKAGGRAEVIEPVRVKPTGKYLPRAERGSAKAESGAPPAKAAKKAAKKSAKKASRKKASKNEG